MTTLVFAQALLPDGWADNVRVDIANGRIVRVTSGATAAAGDERHAIGLPGMPNLHSHAFQRGMAGLAETRGPATDSFWTWREQMYRFALAMSPDDVEAVAAQAYVEMLESGFTRVGEFHYLHHAPDGEPYTDIAEMAARIAAAAADTGIGLTLLPVFYAHANFGGAAPLPEQRRFVTSLHRYGRLVDASRRHIADLPGAVVGVAPHSLRAVTPEELAAVVALAPGGPVHIHVAEQTKEVDDCVAWSGARPVAWLLDRAAPDDRWCFVHATHMTADEAVRMAAAGVTAGLCPVTEANLGDGIFNARPYLEIGGGRFGIGTDSNVLISVSDELRQFEYAQRLATRERNFLCAPSPGASTGRALFEVAHAGGASALGASAGGLAVGAAADIVSLDAGHPALVGRRCDQLLDAWIFAARGCAVDCVWRWGAKVVAEGRHVKRDRVARRFRATMERLLA